MPTIRMMIALVLLSAAARAEESDSTRTYLLGEVVVSGHRDAVVRASSVSDIDRNELSLRDALAVSSGIALSPGIYLRTNARNEAVPTMRGFDARQVATFLDGVPLALPYDGTIDLDQLTIAQVAKVTTSRGMPSILYGPNSMGGTINVVTQEPGPTFGGTLRLEGGTTNAGLFSLGQGGDILSWFLAAEYSRSLDFPLPSSVPPELDSAGARRANSGSQGYSLSAKLGFGSSPAGRIRLSIAHTDHPKGVPTNIYTSRPRYWRYTEWKKTIYTLAGETLLGGDAALKATAFYQTYYNVLDSYDDASLTTQTARFAFHSIYDDYSLGGSMIASTTALFASPLKVLVSGRRDVHREQSSASTPATRFAAETYSVGLEQEAQLAAITGVLGLGLDVLHPSEANNTPPRESAHAWGGHAGVIWQLHPMVSLHAHAALRSRFPTLKELYSENLGLNLPNPDLAPERSLNLELGLDYRPFRPADLTMALFYSNVHGLIQNVFLTPSERQLQNLGKALLAGLEFSGRATLEYHTFEAGYTFLVAENRTEGASSSRIEHRPRHVVSLAVDRRLPAHAALRVEAQFISSRWSVDLDNGSWEELEGYWTLNLRAGIHLLKELEVFGRFDNVTDTYYESEYGYPQPGRTFALGFQGSL